ncbi:MAG: four-carbon acid sugar kinase family protein [Pseudorhizobium sp.]
MLVIIADDLTGALDTAAPFAARGLHAEVVLTADAVTTGLAQSPDVLAINLASREKRPEEAFGLMKKVIEKLPPHIRLFKKVDSRLKGHVAAELDAIAYTRALVAPAIPSFGRFVRDGHVEGFGVSSPISVTGALGHHAARSTIMDARTDRDLNDALAAADVEAIDLLVGARGLAEALALRMTGQSEAELVAPPTGWGLFVIGSNDRITLEQVERLRDLDNVSYFAAPNGDLEPGDQTTSPLVLVQATPGKTKMSSQDVARNLAGSVHPRLTTDAQTLLLCGGATAEAVLARMGIECFRLEGECLPGLGLAYAGGQCIIAKSGGFGQPETLAVLAGKLHGVRG